MKHVAFFLMGFLLSLACVYFVGRFNRRSGIVGRDVNKLDRRVLAEGTGIALLVPLWVAVVALLVVIYSEWHRFNLFYFIFGLAVSGFSFVGLLDDTKHKFSMRTTPWIFRAVPIAFISLLFGAVHFHNPLWAVLIALFVAGLASLENTFAGLNGWEIGSGFIISCFVTLIVSRSADPNLVFLSLALNGMVLGLLFWNCFPARVFPGDSGTLLIGSAIAALLVMNQRIEMILLGFLFFLPHLFDFFGLKILTNPRDVSQSRALPYAVLPDGRLTLPLNGNGRKLDFAKLLLKLFGPLREWQIVLVIWAIVLLNCLFWSKLFGIV